MIPKSLEKKLRTALATYRNDGSIGILIKSLEYTQKKSRKKDGSNNKLKIDTSAVYEDVLSVDISKPANQNWKAPKIKKEQLVISWLMPPPGKGSGGHMTIWRFISYLEKSGHVCRIYFHNPGRGSSVKSVLDAMDNSFPEVKAEMKWLAKEEEIESSDILIATSWQTAYSVYKSSVNAKKMYFVQDFEPYFYPVGGLSMLAENTYRFGLRGITAGGWLESKLNREYGMTTSSFKFGSDSDTYRHENTDLRSEIVFYARPTTPRRAFDLGIATLDLFHRIHPEITINFIGWDVSEFDIPFPYKNLGILTPDQLNKVYNKSAASLVMSLTNMSLLPLELLSTGCIPVVNEGDNNRLVSNNPYIEYCLTDPLSLARKLSEVVSKKDLPEISKLASSSVANESWEDAGEKVVKSIVKSYYSDGDA